VKLTPDDRNRVLQALVLLLDIDEENEHEDGADKTLDLMKHFMPPTPPFWHFFNPWKDKVVYVPIKRLAECVSDDPRDVSYMLERWTQRGVEVDAYILPQQHVGHLMGIRYGARDYEYYSPHNVHPERTQRLLEEFRCTQ
jgi:hypothetical protein